jgi:acetolactate synthase-1/2/3 large subunit
MSKTVSGILLEILKRHGIRNVFGLPAAQLGLVMDGVSRDPFFNYVTTRHEEACGHMAHAAAKVTGSMAVCFGTVGPGGTNMVPGVACAWADNVPILVLTPNNQSTAIDPGRDLLQNSPQLDLYKPITKWNAQIRYAERAPELIERALYIARSGRPGPVHLDIPCDIGTHACDYDVNNVPLFELPRPVPSGSEMERLVAAVTAARRPLLLAGGGVARSGATEEFRKLMDLSGFPATTTMNAKGVVPLNAPGHIGSGGVLAGKAAVQACKEADLILAVGCKFSSWIPVNKPPAYPVPGGQQIIQVDSDPDSLGKTAPVSQAIVADAREFLKLLNSELESASFNLDTGWMQALSEETGRYRREVDAIADKRVTEGTDKLNEAAVARAFAGLIPDDAIMVIDGGQVMEWGHTFMHPRDPGSFIFGAGMGHLGMGLPFANAAKKVCPDRPVVLITGDGAMGCTIQELETAARYNLDIIVLVCNDSYWGMYRPFGEELFNNKNFGVRLTDVGFAAAAKAFGCYGELVAGLDDLPAAYRRAEASKRPAVLEIAVDFTPHPMDGFWVDVVLKGMELAQFISK